MRHNHALQISALFSGLLAGCATPAASGDSQGESGSETDEGETGEAETDETETEDEERVPARGISITQVEANQGVGIPIGLDGAWVDGPSRNTRLLSGRSTLVRLHHELAEGWIPREVEARLRLTDGAGTSLVYTAVEMIDADSDPGKLSGSFTFELDADAGATKPEFSYEVELFEVEGASPSAALEALPEGIWATPSSGPGFVGFEDLDAEFDLVIVPITFEGVTPTIDGNKIHNRMMRMMPVSAVNLEIHEPLEVEGPLAGMDALFWPLEQLREAEDAPPYVYYYAVIETHPSQVNQDAWYAPTSGADKDDANERIAGILDWGDWMDLELHQVFAGNQGLQRIDCTGFPVPNPNPNYPYPDGLIGSWGFDITSGRLFDPGEIRDISTRCNPAWVSDYSWNLMLNRIRTLTAWKYE